MSKRFSIAVLIAVLSAAAVEACPFCAKLGPTLGDRIAGAEWAAVGVSVDGVRFRISHRVKQPASWKLATEVLLTKSIGPSEKPRLVIGRLEKTGLRPTRVQTVGDDVGSYLAALESHTARPARIEFLFRHLDHADQDVREDAYKAMSKYSAAEIAEQSPKLDVAMLRKMIRDPKHPATRIGLFGFLLGMAGDKADAELLASTAASKETREMAARDGFLAGLALLDRPRAETLALRQLSSPAEPFSGRQAALNALTFVLDEMPRRDETPILRGMIPALAIADLRDAVVDVLRMHTASFAAPEAFAKADAKTPSRALVKFALLSVHPDAVKYLAEVRRLHPDTVAAARSDLAVEARDAANRPPRIAERR